jgi:hypothetical protein
MINSSQPNCGAFYNLEFVQGKSDPFRKKIKTVLTKEKFTSKLVDL